MSGRRIGLLLAAVSLVAATGAAADGGPIDTSDSPSGVTLPGANVRYVALIAPRGTVVAQVDRHTGRVLRNVPLRGDFAIPNVGLNGTTGGLSTRGDVLVLTGRRIVIPRRRSAFAVFDAGKLRLRRIISLKGDYSFDALSPDGRTLYLIQYLAPLDLTKYAVRAYDVRAGKLRPKPIVDPNEHAGEMRGYPLSRVYSPDGRWAYTLYDGNGKEPFVHALDTVRGRAVCIDAPMLTKRPDIQALAIKSNPGGRTLSVVDDLGHPAATVDTRTLRASAPRSPDAPARPRHDGGGGGIAWPLVAFGLLLSAARAIGVRRRRRLAPG